ncbi:uncharacterized DUF497 family protein [Salinibacter ruber]|jgi:uncharacterized DUF497 family protein|uniref:BrnT family toxin n=1 Tax=Salinibacter ruber TaxID=146919 RepID=UPI001F087B3A|nr:BrnT family toxin [Salinibacter ruber]MCS3658151.1 uncharacterized DUF497 family protein [Salinibacter ruber]
MSWQGRRLRRISPQDLASGERLVYTDVHTFERFTELPVLNRPSSPPRPMKFDWHDEKRKSNIEKHDLDFLDAIQVFEEEHFMEDRTREEEWETRKAIIGPLPEADVPGHWSGNLIVVVFTPRNDTIRIISARRASTDERRCYERHVG